MKRIFSIMFIILIALASVAWGADSNPIRGNQVITGDLYLGGSIVNAANTAAIAAKLNKVGSATNDSATAGDIGELKISTVAFANIVSETSATPVNVTSLSLTAGDWDVSGVINRNLAGVTATVYGRAISPTTGAVPAQAGGSGVGADSVVIQTATFGTTITGNYITAIGPVRVSLAVTTTIYLVAADTFSAGTLGVFGTLRARRIR